ncbi:hypothetical protein F4801DRAFT_548036 [Xylaria longipes]|nr:hypothetical protein F4801DRAFT_548036 [Xylaria longipes]RYC59725.1 hypothetical protein CHU98_g6476 [Xylaria longipes]
MRLIFISVLFGMSLASPMFKGNENPTLVAKNMDADDLVKNSWSARATSLREATTDDDDLVHNSWSARSELGNLPREAVPDADDLVHNSWSARA